MFNRNNSKKVTETAVEGLLPIVQDRLQKEVFQNSAGELVNIVSNKERGDQRVYSMVQSEYCTSQDCI